MLTGLGWAETTTMLAATVADLTAQETSKATLTTAAEASSVRVYGAARAARPGYMFATGSSSLC